MNILINTLWFICACFNLYVITKTLKLYRMLNDSKIAKIEIAIIGILSTIAGILLSPIMSFIFVLIFIGCFIHSLLKLHKALNEALDEDVDNI